MQNQARKQILVYLFMCTLYVYQRLTWMVYHNTEPNFIEVVQEMLVILIVLEIIFLEVNEKH